MSENVNPPLNEAVTADKPTPNAADAPFDPKLRRGLRVWPGLLIAIFCWACIIVPTWLTPGREMQMYGMMFGPMLSTLLFLLWWVFLSRASWTDVGLALAACIAGAVLLTMTKHPSFGGLGMMIYTGPTLMLVWSGWLAVSGKLTWPTRRAILLVSIVAVWAAWATLRFDGTNGVFQAQLTPRWKPTAQDRFREYQASLPTKAENPAAAIPQAPLVAELGDWPGFRGPKRDGRVVGIRMTTDWNTRPPALLWKHPVGEGWSSFCVIEKNAYTQEQRGAKEAVVCYDSDTGAERWVHQDDSLFEEAVGGPGPRATPTFHAGKLYALGAKGILNCLDARTGAVIWKRDLVEDSGRSDMTDAKNPKYHMWGFSSSPLVVDGVVTVFAGQPVKAGDAKDAPEGPATAVLGYDAQTGDPVWHAGRGKNSYSSLQPAVIDGVEQVLMMTELGVTSFKPKTGELLWEHEWLVKDMPRCVQPAVVGNDILISTGFGYGMRRAHVEKTDKGWSTREVWTTKKISPYYNDFVVHQDFLYGFDGPFFCCVSLADGKTKWRARDYDNGQVILVADQGTLVVQAEKGFVALVEANPKEHVEIARIDGIEGKTWNHPVIANGRLFIRNSDEAAVFQLRAGLTPKEK